MLILSTAFGLAFQRQFRDSIQPHIVQYLEYVLRDIGDPPSLERAQALAQRLPIEIYLRGPGGDWSSSPRPLDLSRFHDWHARQQRPWIRGKVRIADDERGRFLIHVRNGDSDIYLVSQGRDKRRHGGTWVGAGAISVLLLLLLLCYWVIRRLFQPIAIIQDGVRHIAAGDLAHRVQIKRRDELGDLAASINSMAGELEKMLEAKRQLLLAISHELRSPLTRAKVNTALLEQSSARSALEQDLKEMEVLLGELLESERLSGRHSVLNLQPVAVNALLDEVISEHFSHSQLTVGHCEEDLYLLLDPVRIKLLLKNLLDNALRYSPPELPPSLKCQFDGKELQLLIQDQGPGIAPEHLPHLTDPFYRVDPARQRKTGGYGLGLYLCRVIAQAHGGTLTIDSTPGQGTRVTVTLPVGNNESEAV
ncbi:MAG: HAMP domain-containing sensor histidine kinase [Gammaproteobacteria bacterium]